MNKPFCIIPFIGYHVTSGNLGRICNMGNHPITQINENTNLQKLWHDNIQEQHYYDGTVPIACKECYDQEAKGLKTRRVRFRKLATMFDFDINNSELQYLNINFSNICNLDCVMCSSEFSSRWIQNDKKIKFPFRDIDNKYLKINRVPYSFIDQIKIKELKAIEIKGGEPLIDASFLYFLKKFINDNGDALIHITTNLNSLTVEFKNLLSKLPKVSFDVSVDAIGDLYHYTRGKNSSIKNVVENFKFIKGLKGLYDLRVNITTMPYNLWDSYKVIDWVKSIDENIIVNWCNIVSVPQYIEPSLIPYSLRKEAIKLTEDFIDKTNVNKKHLLDLKIILNYLSKENPRNDDKQLIKYKQKTFIEWTDYINELRNMNVYEIVPQLEKAKNIILNEENI